MHADVKLTVGGISGAVYRVEHIAQYMQYTTPKGGRRDLNPCIDASQASALNQAWQRPQ